MNFEEEMQSIYRLINEVKGYVGYLNEEEQKEVKKEIKALEDECEEDCFYQDEELTSFTKSKAKCFNNLIKSYIEIKSTDENYTLKKHIVSYLENTFGKDFTAELLGIILDKNDVKKRKKTNNRILAFIMAIITAGTLYLGNTTSKDQKNKFSYEEFDSRTGITRIDTDYFNKRYLPGDVFFDSYTETEQAKDGSSQRTIYTYKFNNESIPLEDLNGIEFEKENSCDYPRTQKVDDGEFKEAYNVIKRLLTKSEDDTIESRNKPLMELFVVLAAALDTFPLFLITANNKKKRNQLRNLDDVRDKYIKSNLGNESKYPEMILKKLYSDKGLF